MTASADDVRAMARRVLAAYGLDDSVVTAMSLDLNAYGVQELHVRLLITPAALAALESR